MSDAPRPAFVLTTHEGLEPRVLADLRALGLVGHAPSVVDAVAGEAGRVYVDAPEARLPELRTLRSIHHVLRPRGARRFDAPSLDELTAFAAELSFPELEREVSFAVRCEREGEHHFTSPEVERAVGAALVQRYGRPVDLSRPDVLVSVTVRDAHVAVDVRLTEVALSHRAYPRPYQQRTALKADVAYACLRAAEEALGATPRAVVDPFCGSGTILLEAAELFPQARLFGSDKKPDAARGTAANLRAFGHEARARVVTAELDLAPRRLGSDRTGELDQASRRLGSDRTGAALVGADWTTNVALVTNPPYGVRMGARLDFRQLYARLLRAFDVPVRVVLAVDDEALRAAASALGLRAEVRLRPRTGSVAPALVVVSGSG